MPKHLHIELHINSNFVLWAKRPGQNFETFGGWGKKSDSKILKNKTLFFFKKKRNLKLKIITCLTLQAKPSHMSSSTWQV